MLQCLGKKKNIRELIFRLAYWMENGRKLFVNSNLVNYTLVHYIVYKERVTKFHKMMYHIIDVIVV